MMMGSLEEDVLAVARPPEEEMPEVVNDLDIEDEEVAIERREVYLSKVFPILKWAKNTKKFWI